jgi:hypothetical protein
MATKTAEVVIRVEGLEEVKAALAAAAAAVAQAHADGYQKAIANLRDHDKYRAWVNTLAAAGLLGVEPLTMRHAAYLEAQAPDSAAEVTR